ncbi:MAG: TldD/PmbA family protein [Theionarchaea archaeon]|nr:TldD/PmbA family protein [Theionarchaea archaeon]
MDCHRYGEKVISFCSRIVSECEVCIEDRTEKTVTIQKDEIKSEREKHEITMGLRVFAGKRKGFKAVTLPQNLEEVADSAVTLARHSEKDEDWHGLPLPKPVAAVDIYDQKVAEISIEELVEMSTLLKSPFPEVFIDSARVTTFASHMYIMNSQEVNHAYKATKCYIFLLCLPQKGEASAAMDWALSRKLDIDCELLAEKTARTVKDSLKAKLLKENFKGEVLFSENVCSQVFMNSLAAAVNAESFKRNVSPFKEKMNERVASGNITVTDDGLLPEGVCSAPFDREGNPCQKTLVIDKGILGAILHNEYTGRQYHTESTGNAVGSAMAEPLVGITNLILTPGEHSTEEIIETMKKGMYILGLSGGTDVTTGRFSGVVPHGYYIEKGEIKYPARALISGNSFSSLLTVHLLGGEQKPNLEGMYGVPLLVEGINIISGSG